MIGSGIFFAPSIMAGYLQSPGLLLGLWVLGGLLTLAGALSYAELAAAMPRAGGQYVFLSEAFSPLFGFLYGWTFLLAINTGFVAAVAVAFAKTLGFFVPGVGEEHLLFALGGVAVHDRAARGPRRDRRAHVDQRHRPAHRAPRCRTSSRSRSSPRSRRSSCSAVVTARGRAANFQPLLGLALGPEGVQARPLRRRSPAP